VPLAAGPASGEEALMSNHDDRGSKSEVVWLDDTGSGRGDPPTERVLSLKNVARMFGVSQLCLRYYEMRGLIHRRHSLDGVRVYGWADCERIAFIIKCHKAGVKMSDIIMVVQATEDDISPLQFKMGQEICMNLVDRLETRRKVIDEGLAELSHVYALLTAKLLGDNRPNRDEP
jgi:DNA-binding transcriptional MerR regulator